MSLRMPHPSTWFFCVQLCSVFSKQSDQQNNRSTEESTTVFEKSSLFGLPLALTLDPGMDQLEITARCAYPICPSKNQVVSSWR
mmetsp:Transcript_32977/g.51435  ORF Transcript_32977/g.51435 Transcript_32977/m.51435 type:complete len:84 (-) Transcript_32977:148-399(-)